MEDAVEPSESPSPLDENEADPMVIEMDCATPTREICAPAPALDCTETTAEVVITTPTADVVDPTYRKPEAARAAAPEPEKVIPDALIVFVT